MFLGIDFDSGRSELHAAALDCNVTRLYDKAFPSDEATRSDPYPRSQDPRPGPACGQSPRDHRDAVIIEKAARTLPHGLHPVRLEDKLVADLLIACGFADDLVGQITATNSRIRGLPMRVNPKLERGPEAHLSYLSAGDALLHYSNPAALRAARKP